MRMEKQQLDYQPFPSWLIFGPGCAYLPTAPLVGARASARLVFSQRVSHTMLGWNFVGLKLLLVRNHPPKQS